MKYALLILWLGLAGCTTLISCEGIDSDRQLHKGDIDEG